MITQTNCPVLLQSQGERQTRPNKAVPTKLCNLACILLKRECKLCNLATQLSNLQSCSLHTLVFLRICRSVWLFRMRNSWWRATVFSPLRILSTALRCSTHSASGSGSCDSAEEAAGPGLSDDDDVVVTSLSADVPWVWSTSIASVASGFAAATVSAALSSAPVSCRTSPASSLGLSTPTEMYIIHNYYHYPRSLDLTKSGRAREHKKIWNW